MNEIYTKRDIFDSLEDTLKDTNTQRIFLHILANKKYKKLNNEMNSLFIEYEKRYLPIIKENKGRKSEDYSISQNVVSEINKHMKKLNNATKQRNFYLKMLNCIDYDKNDIRTKKIFKALFKHFGFKFKNQIELDKY